MIFAKIVFWICAGALFHSYVLYPLLLKWLTRNKKPDETVYEPTDAPPVTVVIAAYNEERVITAKLESVYACGYPHDRLRVLVGSDCSTDGTAERVRACAARFPGIELVEFTRRTGKIGIVNELVARAHDEILILTDANVMFGDGAIFNLVRHFRNPQVSLVDSHMIQTGSGEGTVSAQEKTYISNEVAVKHAEGLWAGCMIGPFGGGYALRKKHFSQVPAHFLVDDFYINMRIIEQGYRCINDLNARVYEEVGHSLGEEYRRKARIATGSFQNLAAFRGLLFRGDAVSFCFFSHKVLRWLGPGFLLGALAGNAFLLDLPLYRATGYAQAAFYALPLIDGVWSRTGARGTALRYVTHFLVMNAALLAGFFRFMKGVDTSVWQPTQRTHDGPAG